MRIHERNYIWAEWKDGGEAKTIRDFLEFWDRVSRSKEKGWRYLHCLQCTAF